MLKENCFEIFFSLYPVSFQWGQSAVAPARKEGFYLYGKQSERLFASYSFRLPLSKCEGHESERATHLANKLAKEIFTGKQICIIKT